MTIFFSIDCRKDLLEKKYGDKYKPPYLQVTKSSWEEFVHKLEEILKTQTVDVIRSYSSAPKTLREPIDKDQGTMYFLAHIEIFLTKVTLDENDSKYWIYNQFLEMVSIAANCSGHISWD